MTPTLSDEHAEYLSAARITPDIAAAAGVYTATEPEHLPAELAGWAERGLPGIVFPWHPAAGGEPVHQLRPDRPVPRSDGEGYAKYLFSVGAGLVMNTHPLMAERVHNVGTPLVVIEGTKQYLAGVSALANGALAAVGMSGCYGWSQDGAPITDLRAIPWSDRTVFLCFDADVAHNRDVWEAAERLMGWLKTAGAGEVKLVDLPGGSNTGLDDVLAQVADPIEAMLRLLDSAKEKLPRRPAKRRSGTYFDEEGGLLAEKAASALLEEHPCALAADGTIAVYDAGRYVVERDSLMAFVADMLGDRHRPIHTATITQVVTSKLMIERKRLTDRQRGGLLNVRNGMLDLRTGELHPHSPDYMSVAQVPVDWDPAASCPTYDRWLDQVCTAEQIGDLEEVASTMLDPSRTPHKSMFLFGPSRSGKSTFLRIMRAVAGPENTSGVTLHQLSDDKFSTANLYGKSLNVAADLSSRHIEDLSVWKMLTGEDLISANLKYGSMFSFTNQALFAFSANELPTVSESSRAYFERIKPFRFGFSFAGTENPKLEEMIIESELSGVLARWRRAFVRLRERGQFCPTAPDIEAEFEVSSDRVRLWMADEMVIVATLDVDGVPQAISEGRNCPTSHATPSARLYEAFTTWTKENGYSAVGKQKFLRRLTSLNGVAEVRVRPTSIRGLNIIKRTEDQHTEQPLGTMGRSETTLPYTGFKDVDQGKSESCIGEDASEIAQTAYADVAAARIPVSALTGSVYDAIAADPAHATEGKIRTELGLSSTEFKTERDYLVSRLVIRRRPGRGYEVLCALSPTPTAYAPLTDPALVNDADGRPSARELMVFDPPCCRFCDEPDDGASRYFPLCTFHREEVAA